MTILSVLVALVVLALLWWAITAILRAFGVGDPIATLVKVIFVMAVVLWLLGGLGYGPGFRLR